MRVTSSWDTGLGSSLCAGLAYAAIVFAIGFVLGTLRMLLVVPRVGATTAVLLETPSMLIASWWVSRRCISRYRVSAQSPAPLLMGAVAFVTLMLLEIALSDIVFGRPLQEYLSSFTSLPGVIGLAAQLAFAIFPLVQAAPD